MTTEVKAMGIERLPDGKKLAGSVWAWGAEQYPYAATGTGGRLISLDLHEPDASRFIRRLAFVCDGAREHSHVGTFMEDGTTMYCEKCSEPMTDEGAPAVEPAAQASMLT